VLLHVLLIFSLPNLQKKII